MESATKNRPSLKKKCISIDKSAISS